MKTNPTSYACIPWDFSNDEEYPQLIVGSEFKSWNKQNVANYNRSVLWFKGDVLDTVEWAYEGQRDKVLAVLSKWILTNSKGIEQSLHYALLFKALGETTQVEFLFTEYTLFNERANIKLIQLIDDIKDKFLFVGT